jgi:hypothetical protein
LDYPDKLISFLEIQEPLIHIRITSRPDKNQLCDLIRISLLTGYEKMFGLTNSYKVASIGFDINDNQKFKFTN